MARIQCLPLPGERFILVIDGMSDTETAKIGAATDVLSGFKRESGADAILCFDGTMDVA